MALKDWSETAANNDDADVTINWAEGQAPSTVNGSARSMMAVIKKALGHIVSVKDYGAVGDGITDDTSSIQDAVDSLSNGGTIYFPAGEYLISSTISKIVASASTARGGYRFVGDGRWATLLTYTGTSGYCISLVGTAVDTAGSGLMEGIDIRHMRLAGTGKSSGNTDSGIYIQGFQYACIEDVRISDFGQDGLRIDRLYYAEAPDATLDDRGAFVRLARVHALNCGRHSGFIGGSTASTDYSVDHLVTETCHFSSGTTTGLKINANNWVDNASIFHGDSIGCHIYGLSSTKPVLSIVWNATRCEGGPTDSNLTIEQAQHFIANGAFFVASTGPAPATGVKIATSASFNVGYVELRGCRWSVHTTALDVVGTGNVTNVRVVDPIYSSVTTKIANANSKVVQLIEGRDVQRVTSGGITIRNNPGGLSDGVIEQWFNAGDTQPFMHVDSTNLQFGLGAGGSTAIDLLLQRGVTGDGTTAALQLNRNIRLAGPAHIMSGTGDPEGAVTASVGSIFLRTNGGSGSTFYVKESGTGNTGWDAK